MHNQFFHCPFGKRTQDDRGESFSVGISCGRPMVAPTNKHSNSRGAHCASETTAHRRTIWLLFIVTGRASPSPTNNRPPPHSLQNVQKSIVFLKRSCPHCGSFFCAFFCKWQFFQKSGTRWHIVSWFGTFDCGIL